MLALLFLTGAALFGLCLTRRVLRRYLSGAEHILWGVVIGWSLATLLVYALARWQGRLAYTQIVSITLLLWVSAGVLHWLSVYRRDDDRPVWRTQYFGLCLVLLLFAPIYWKLYSSHMLSSDAGGIYSGGSTWQDISFHAALTSSFVYGENLPPVYTPLPPEFLLYPFLPDFQTAILVTAGLGMHTALVLTGLMLALVITGLLFFLAWRIVQCGRTAALATMLFLLNGGFGFLYFYGDWKAGGAGFFHFWNSLTLNYANMWERGIHWTNVVTDTLLPQRTSLFGLSLGLIIITLFASVWRNVSTREHNRETLLAPAFLFLVAGALTGLLSLVHLHTFFAVGFVSIGLFLMRPARYWLAFWLPALLLAAPQILSVSSHAYSGSYVHLHLGWMGPAGWQMFPYVLKNFGLPLVLATPAWLAMPRIWRMFYLSFAGLLVISFVFALSPNVFDNIKLMHYWHAINSIFVAAWLIRVAQGAWPRKLLASALVLLSIASGVLALRAEANANQSLFTSEEMTAAAFGREHTSPHALFLTAPVINQPILCLAGRAILRGPTAWLWSHGYEFRDREADIKRIYAGASDAIDLLRYYQVDFVYLGPFERKQLQANDAFFEKNFSPYFSSANIRIYDVRSLSPPRTERGPTLAPRELASRVGRDPYAMIAEFSETSFFVYRMYRASFGRLPRLAEFLNEMRALGGGVYPGREKWRSQLETNQQSLLQDWTAREAFTAQYNSKSNREFVEALLANAGLSSDHSLSARLVETLESGKAKRTEVLRQVIDNSKSYVREYNTAFVLIHFFGYLGRNPDDLPDHDLSGLNYWREILDRTRDYRSISRAFMESMEYQKRRVLVQE